MKTAKEYYKSTRFVDTMNWTLEMALSFADEYHASQSSDKEERDIESVLDLFESIRDADSKDWSHNRQRMKEILLSSIISPPKESEGKELSEITDEDAIECAYRIFESQSESNIQGVELAKFMRTEYLVDEENINSLTWRAYQYLQSKGYKLPKYF